MESPADGEAVNVEDVEFHIARAANAPQTGHFFVNDRGQNLHVRSFLPTPGLFSQQCEAVVFFLHGYTGHMGRPDKMNFGDIIGKQNVACLSYDQVGHGYSDGLRALLATPEEYVRDIILFIRLVLGKEDQNSTDLGIPPKMLRSFQNIPFYLMGESMGGGLAILASLRIQEQFKDGEAANDFSTYAGTILVAPAIVGNPPPAPVVWLLEKTLVKWCPEACIPDFLETVHLPELTWTEEESRLRVLSDHIDNGGLSWGKNMRYQSGFNLIKLTSELQSRLSEIEFPFLIIHDEADQIVLFDGSKRMKEESQTKEEDKTLQVLQGSAHDLVCNVPSAVVEHAMSFIRSRSSKQPFITK